MYLASVFNNNFILFSIRLLSALILLTFCFISCKKDDSPINSIPANDYLDQHNIDNDSIIDFMQNHFYNYNDYVNLSPDDGPELIIDSIKGDNSNKTPIYDQVSSFQIDVKDSDGNYLIAYIESKNKPTTNYLSNFTISSYMDCPFLLLKTKLVKPSR